MNPPEPPPVKLNRYPGWYVPRIRQAIKDGRLPPICRHNRFTGGYHHHLLNKAGLSTLFDHAGRCGDLLVTEPYDDPDSRLLKANVKRLASLLDLDFRIRRESNWLPGATCRIEFWPTPENLPEKENNMEMKGLFVDRSQVENLIRVYLPDNGRQNFMEKIIDGTVTNTNN